MFNGVRVVESSMAVSRTWKIGDWPVRKRRRRYRVVVVEKPCVYSVAGVIYAHPLLYQQMRNQLRLTNLAEWPKMKA